MRKLLLFFLALRALSFAKQKAFFGVLELTQPYSTTIGLIKKGKEPV